MKELRGRTALLTGASRGIGPHIARALVNEGMNVVLTARSLTLLERVARELQDEHNRIRCMPADLSEHGAVEALVERAESKTGGIDVLVNNAALETVEAFDQSDPETLSDMIEVNLRAPMMLSRLLFPKMLARGRGHIVNIASLSGLAGSPFQETYCATKHGLIGFSRSLSATIRSEGHPVGSSVICPGFVKAGMYEDMTRVAKVTAPRILGISTPERIADAVVRAIRKDLPEIIVNPMPVRPILMLAVFAPRLAAWVVSKLGAETFFRTVARHGFEALPSDAQAPSRSTAETRSSAG